MQKEKIKKHIEKTIVLFAFLFFSVFLMGVLMSGKIEILKIYSEIVHGLIPSPFYGIWGMWGAIIFTPIYFFPALFILFIIFEIVNNFLNKNLRLAIFVLTVLSLFISYFIKETNIFYCLLAFFSLLMLFWLFRGLIPDTKKGIKLSVICLVIFVLIIFSLKVIFPSYKSIEISYTRQNCNTYKDVCLNNMQLGCRLVNSHCRGSGYGISTIDCTYACPR